MSALDKHALTCRGALLPDPRYDAVRAIVMAVNDDNEDCSDALYMARILLYDVKGTTHGDGLQGVQVSCGAVAGCKLSCWPSNGVRLRCLGSSWPPDPVLASAN